MSVKISELPLLDSLADNDVLAGVDTSADTTSKVTVGTLKEYIDSNTQYTAGTNIDITNDVVSAPNVYNKTEVDNLIDNIDLTDYVKNTDYASDSKAGVIKIGSLFGTKINSSNGYMSAIPKTYAEYTSGGNEMFIGKATLENVITGKDLTTKAYVDSLVGDINTALDTINGEVV